MPGKTPHGAVEAFLEPLRASSSCLTKSQWIYNSPKGKPVGGLFVALLNAGDRVPIRRGGDRLFFEATIQFTVVERAEDKFGRRVPASERFKVSTRGYMYTTTSEDESELMAYHWHPDAKGNIPFPHQHFTGVEGEGGAGISRKYHMRTGRMSFEDALFNLIEMGATPINLNFAAILERNRSTFEQWKSWG
jgi:hypothetical protein